MDDELSRITSNGMTVSITRTNGMRVTADKDIKAGATWETSEVNHLSLSSAIGGFLNASLDREMGAATLDIDYVEIGATGGGDSDLRIGVGPDGVHLMHVGNSGEVSHQKMTEMGVDLLIEKLLAYKGQRDGLLSEGASGT